MSIRKRLDRLEGAMGAEMVVPPEVHFADLREWSEAEQVAYGKGTDEERRALVARRFPDAGDRDIVFIVESELAWATRRPGG